MKINKIFDKSFILFVFTGVVNTLISVILMFLLENLGYFKSTVTAYIAGGLVSFFLNRYVTFKYKGSFLKSLLKFTVNIALCFTLAYSLALPTVSLALSFTNVSSLWQERISKLFGMGLYTVINYLGQKFFTFKETAASRK